MRRRAYAGGIPTHYEVLGVSPDAPTSAIRSSYRARARLHHPDRGEGGADGVTMADVNEAYRVLKDPARRALYDRSLATGRATADTVEAPVDDVTVGRPRRSNPLSPEGPARYPWKAMLVVGLVGSLLVLVSAAMSDPPGEEVPDGIIRTNSCIAIEPNGDAREVACTGEGDLVVELLIPLDARCPAGMQPHRDRLGLGIACIVP